MRRRPQLFDPPPFPHPTRFGATHYVPVLKNLPGEMKALTKVAPAARDRMTPLIEIDTKSKGTGEAPRSSRLPRLPEELGLIFQDRPFFLDFQSVTARQKVSVGRGRARGPVPAIEYVIDECDQRMLNFVPVVRDGLDAGLVHLFKEVTGDGRGACLRLPVNGVFSPDGFGTELARLLDVVDTEPAVTDVVVDLQYIESSPGFEARHIRTVLEGLPWILDWRSIILIGTVIPKTLSGFQEDRVTRVPRHEWRFWNELRSLGTLRVPTFGDYAIQNPARPQDGGPGMRANIRYSTPEAVLVARGRSLTQHGSEQYRDLCAALVQRPEFRGDS